MPLSSQAPPGFQRAEAGRSLYVRAAIAASLIVLAGFARTYYLKSAFGTPPLSMLRHVHGAIMTLWFALFIAQVSLVKAGRTDLHRRLGELGAVLLVLVPTAGVMLGIDAARRDLPGGPAALAALIVPVGDMAIFVSLAGAGLLLRRRSDLHKRLMLLSTLSLLPPAFARIPLEPFRSGGLAAAFAAASACVLVCVIYDTRASRRLHPALAWGFALSMVSLPVRHLLASTSAWTRFAAWLVK